MGVSVRESWLGRVEVRESRLGSLCRGVSAGEPWLGRVEVRESLVFGSLRQGVSVIVSDSAGESWLGRVEVRESLFGSLCRGVLVGKGRG